MESRSDSIKDPIYYPTMQEVAEGNETVAETETEKRSRSSAGSQELGLEDGNALKVPRKFIANWRQACDRTRDRTKDLLKRWRTVSANVDEIVSDPASNKQLEHPGWSVHVWSKILQYSLTKLETLHTMMNLEIRYNRFKWIRDYFYYVYYMLQVFTCIKIRIIVIIIAGH